MTKCIKKRQKMYFELDWNDVRILPISPKSADNLAELIGYWIVNIICLPFVPLYVWFPILFKTDIVWKDIETRKLHLSIRVHSSNTLCGEPSGGNVENVHLGSENQLPEIYDSKLSAFHEKDKWRDNGYARLLGTKRDIRRDIRSYYHYVECSKCRSKMKEVLAKHRGEILTNDLGIS